jgi:RND family efflux transporter MFP subunit
MTCERRRKERLLRVARCFAARSAGIILLAAITGVAAGCGGKDQHGMSPAESTVVKDVEVVTAGEGPRESFAEAVGTVRARKIAVVAPQVMGRITSLPVSEGSRVERGALLATIDDTEYRAKLSAAEAMVAEAEAKREEVLRAIAQAEAGKSLAEKTYERFRKLYEEKVVTRQEFEEVEFKKTVAVKDYERALDRQAQGDAKIAQAKAQAKAARTMLSYTRVTAPFAGIITEKKLDAGSMAVPGVPLLVMEDTGRYRIEAPVPETYLEILKVGSKVHVLLGTLTGKELPGTVSEVVPLVDSASRTFNVKVSLPGGMALRTGMFGRILFPTGEKNMLVVPRRAILRIGGYDGLYLVTADNVARLVMVTTGTPHGDDVESLSGIEPGARVAVSPVDQMTDGARVEIRK